MDLNAEVLPCGFVTMYDESVGFAEKVKTKLKYF